MVIRQEREVELESEGSGEPVFENRSRSAVDKHGR